VERRLSIIHDDLIIGYANISNYRYESIKTVDVPKEKQSGTLGSRLSEVD